MIRTGPSLIICALALLSCQGSLSISGSRNGNEDTTTESIPAENETAAENPPPAEGAEKVITWSELSPKKLDIPEFGPLNIQTSIDNPNNEPVTFALDKENSTCDTSQLSISTTGVISGMLDFRTISASTCNLVVTATSGKTVITTTITLDSVDVPEPPVWQTETAAYTVAENTALSITVTASDPDQGETPSYALVPSLMDCDEAGFSVPVAINATTGTMTGTPDFEASNQCTITVRATSGSDSIDLQITLTITDADEPPVWMTFAPAYNATEDQPTAIAVLATDQDLGSSVTYSFDPAQSSCDDGGWSPTIAIDSMTGAITGTPENDAVGNCTLSITATSGSQSVSNTLTITTANVNDAPVAVDDSVTVLEDTATVLSLLGNDYDVDAGDLISIASIGTPTNGVVSIDSNGIVTYTPNPDYDGPDSFTYVVKDASNAQSSAATVTITVSNVDPFVVGNFGGNYKDILIAGNYAYIARGYQGLEVYDITAPVPVLVGKVAVDGYVFNLDKNGNTVYLAAMYGGLVIVDVSDPANPSRRGTAATSDYAYDVVVNGTYAYVAMNLGGAIAIDVADPDNPVQTDIYDTGGTAVAVAVHGTKVLVADMAGGLVFLDASVPSTLGFISTYTAAADVQGISVSGDYAYIGQGLSGLRIIDLTNFPTVGTLGTYNSTGDTYNSLIVGNTAYIGDGSGGTAIVNITDKNSPTLIGSFPTKKLARSVAVYGTRLYMVDEEVGLQTIDISTPASPTSIHLKRTLGQAYRLVTQGTTAYIADINVGIVIADISDPKNPAFIGHAFGPATPTLVAGVAVSGDYVFAACWSEGLRVYDATNKSNPVEIANYGFVSNLAAGLTVDSNYAYIGFGNAGLRIVNITNPASPTTAGSYDGTGETYSATRAGDYVYAAEGSVGLRIFDVTSLPTVTPVRTVNTPGGARMIVVDGEYAYVADDTGGVRIIDIVPPASAFEAANIAAGTVRSLRKSGNYLYVVDHNSGIKVYDVTDPLAPSFKVLVPVNDRAYDIQVVGNVGFVASGWGGLTAIGALPGLGAPP